MAGAHIACTLLHYYSTLQLRGSQASFFDDVGDVRYVFLDYNVTSVLGSSSISSDFYVVAIGLFFKI